MDHFKALLVTRVQGGQSANWVELSSSDLMDGDVDVRITHTTINYKDGLALTGKIPIIRRYPLIPGIDFAGTVVASRNAGFNPGDDVILNGWGVGETHHGGYSQMARVNGSWLIKRPAAISPAESMAIGTAGYTAMLAVLALEAHGVAPDSGPVLVTGAAGGVGSVAVSVLAKLGYHVIGSTGRPQEEGFLKSLGCSEVISRDELSSTARPLGKERWAGAIDVAGSNTLANALSMTRYGGCVAATGLAQGMDLASSVAPFILRGVTLAGIDSVMCPLQRRERAWARLATDFHKEKLASLTVTRPLEDVVALAPEILAGKVRGRVVFEVA